MKVTVTVIKDEKEILVLELNRIPNIGESITITNISEPPTYTLKIKDLVTNILIRDMKVSNTYKKVMKTVYTIYV